MLRFGFAPPSPQETRGPRGCLTEPITPPERDTIVAPCCECASCECVRRTLCVYGLPVAHMGRLSPPKGFTPDDGVIEFVGGPVTVRPDGRRQGETPERLWGHYEG